MSRLGRCSVMLIVIVLLGVLVGPVLAYPGNYTITDLGILPGKANTVLFGIHTINESGDITGYCNNGSAGSGLFGDYFSESAPFLWTKQKGMQALPLLPGKANAIGWNLNDRGQVCGGAGNSWLDMRAVIWEKGTFRVLDPLPSDTESGVEAINNRGDVVGGSGISVDGTANFDHTYPVLWDKGQSVPVPLPIGDYLGGAALDINEKRQIVGTLFTADPGDFFHAVPVIWDKGGITVLGSLGGDYGAAYVINDKGQVVGQASTPGGAYHVFFWERAVMTDLGSLGGSWSGLWDLNNKGQAVGDAFDVNEEDHAILVEKGVIYDLNAMIPADSGWVLFWAVGINEKGEIAGTGLHNGAIRSFILTPTK